MSATQKIKVGNRWISQEDPCYVIAEAGSNHNGNLDEALALIDVASDAGADAVKFQGFRARTLYPETAGRAEYLEDPRSIFEIIESMEMPPGWLPTLASRCRSRGVDFLCTPFDEEWAEVLNEYVPAFKIASYEMSHVPLVRKVLSYGKPTFISTGAATLDEVLEVVKLAREVGNEQIVLLQCTAAYPMPPEAVNARAIVTLREATGCLVGLSDHSMDPLVAPIAAVSLGAVVLEKHFTRSKLQQGPDHRFAVEPDELKRLVGAVRQTQAVLGTGVKEVLEVEKYLRDFARRSVFSARSIRAGETLTEDNIRVLRNGTNAPGLPPREYPALLGRKAAQDVAAGAPITWAMVEDGARLS